jgi:hypothetical protein
MPSSDTPTPDQLKRIPVWAQEHIAWLTMRLGECQKQIAAAHAGPDDSNVLIHYYDWPDRLLGINTPVCFRLRTADHPDGIIEVQHGLGHISVKCNGGALHVTPQSSNVVRVRIGEY